jgi:hypothetical protein
MSKHFSNLPKQLEQYNPESYERYSSQLYSQERKTFDEKGLLHSYNDEPSLVSIESFGKRGLFWHAHGVPYRANNKPVHVVILAHSYKTYDENEKLHSYNGMPASITFYMKDKWNLTWYKKGSPHRENNLPADTYWKVNRFRKGSAKLIEDSYFVDGERHRDGGLPAENTTETQISYIKGYMHNEETHAYSKNRKKTQASIKRWSLYGVDVPEEVFETFKQMEEKHLFPSWVNFLLILEAITESDMKAFSEAEGSFDLPLLWVLRSLGITEEKFKKDVFLFRQKHFDIGSHFYNDEAPFERFIKIVEYKLQQESLDVKKRSEANV